MPYILQFGLASAVKTSYIDILLVLHENKYDIKRLQNFIKSQTFL